MRKRVFALLVMLVLVFAALPADAHAEQDYISSNLGAVEAGLPFSCTLCDNVFPEGVTASFKEGIVPDGCTWYTTPTGEGVQIFIQGTPRTAGEFSFSITLSCAEPYVDALLQCAIRVNPCQPVVQTGSGLSCSAGDSVSVSVYASKNPDDSGVLSYQWFKSAYASNTDGSAISGATASTYAPVTDESAYYYCVVTNTNGSLSASAVSSPIYVQVTQPAVSAISIATMPKKLQYIQGESFDAEGLSLNVHYDNGNQTVIDKGFTVSPEKLESSGRQTVNVSYKGLSCSFTVEVEPGEPTIESLSVLRMPSKTVYTVGDRMDSSGMTVRVFTDQGYEDISSGFTCIPNTFMAAGQQTVTVQYEGKSCSFTVEVREEAETLDSIRVNTMPSRLSYTVGEQLNTAGLTLIISTNKGDMMLTEGFSCSPTTLSAVGEQLITVSYNGKSCSFTVEVKPVGQSSTQQTPSATQRPSSGNAASDAVREDRDRDSSAMTVIIVSCVVALIAVGAYLFIGLKKSRSGRR